MRQYLDLLDHIMSYGEAKGDRTGTGTTSIFGYQYRHRLDAEYQDGTLLLGNFPLLTTKEVSLHNILVELLWFLRGETNIKPLIDEGVNIWNAWPYKHFNETNPGGPGILSKGEFAAQIKALPEFAKNWGELGPVYGSQWRKWPDGFEYNAYHWPDDTRWEKLTAAHEELDEGNFRPVYIDQIDRLVNDLRTMPTSRRLIVTAWNPAEIEAMIVSGLPPCHCLFQFNTVEIPTHVRKHMAEGYELLTRGQHPDETDDAYIDSVSGGKVPKYYLDLNMYQRSADTFLGVPYNLASYAALLAMVAREVNMLPRDFIHSFGDVHVYNNHKEQVTEQLTRDPKNLPALRLSGTGTITGGTCTYAESDFALTGYDHHPAIRGAISV